MSKNKQANGNDEVVGIATPAAQGLEVLQKTYLLSWLLLQTQSRANLVKDLKNQVETSQGCQTITC